MWYLIDKVETSLTTPKRIIIIVSMFVNNNPALSSNLWNILGMRVTICFNSTNKNVTIIKKEKPWLG
jgi:hypothetical protein